MKNPHHVALLLVSFAWLLIFIGRVTPATLLVQIVDDLQISTVSAGIGLSGMWLFYGIMQFPGGSLSDIHGRKKIIVVSLICFILASVAIGFNSGFISVIVTFSFMGFAAGLLPAPSFAMIAELFGPSKGKALGIHSTIGGFSGFAPLFLPLFALIIGWRSVFFIWGLLATLLVLLFLRYVSDTAFVTVNKPQKEMIIIGLKALVEKKALFLFIINVIITFAWMGMLSWFPTFLQEDKACSPEIAGALFALMLSGSFILKPIIGHISDKVNRLKIMFILTILGAISLFSFTLADSLLFLMISTFLFSQTSAFYPVRTSYMMDFWSDELSGAKLGVFRSLIVLIGSPIAGIIGWAKDIYGFSNILYMLTAGLILTAFLLAFRLYISCKEPSGSLDDIYP